MRIEFTHERTVEDYRRLFLPGALNRFYAAAGSCVVAGVAGFFVVTRRGDPAHVAGWLPLAGGLLGWAWSVWVLLRRVAVPPGWSAPRRWVISEDGLESASTWDSVRLNWAGVRAVQVGRHAYVVAGRDSALAVPRAPLTAEQDAWLGGFIRERSTVTA